MRSQTSLPFLNRINMEDCPLSEGPLPLSRRLEDYCELPSSVNPATQNDGEQAMVAAESHQQGTTVRYEDDEVRVAVQGDEASHDHGGQGAQPRQEGHGRALWRRGAPGGGSPQEGRSRKASSQPLHVGNPYEVGSRKEGRSSSQPMRSGDSPPPRPTPPPPLPPLEAAALDQREEIMRLAGVITSLMPATMERVMLETEVPTDEKVIQTLRTLEQVLLNAWTQVRLCGEPSAHERENVRNALSQLELFILESVRGAGMLREWIEQQLPRLD